MFIACKQNKHENITYRHIYNINIDTLCIIRGAFFVLYRLKLVSHWDASNLRLFRDSFETSFGDRNTTLQP